ncbi:MAG: hypothetical protein GEU81_00480 [Nitriliruptorales bacterium]|nr:hypothetical protein [Nitriliruptorales bacterium]
MTRSRADYSEHTGMAGEHRRRQARSLVTSTREALTKVRREGPAALLTSVSAILSRGSELAEAGARKLSPTPAQQERSATAPRPTIGADDPAATAGEAPADIGQPTTAVPGPLDEQGHARTYESHIAELATRNVAGVVKQIPDLSTEELGQLFEYESAHRKRKTVLQAIERASTPTDRSRPGGPAGR